MQNAILRVDDEKYALFLVMSLCHVSISFEQPTFGTARTIYLRTFHLRITPEWYYPAALWCPMPNIKPPIMGWDGRHPVVHLNKRPLCVHDSIISISPAR